MDEKIRQLEAQVQELMQFMEQKKRQQITLPLDEASQGALGGTVFPTGASGSFGTQVVVDSNGDTSTVPAQPGGTRGLNINGEIVNILIE